MTDITVKAEKKAVHLRRLLYVVIWVETNRDSVSTGKKHKDRGKSEEEKTRRSNRKMVQE